MTDTDRKVWQEFVYDTGHPDEDVVTLARRTIGLLLQASQATFDMHAGDLIFDYLWLVKYAKPADGPEVTPIWWAHDRHGTAIGQDIDLVACYRTDGLYKISIPQPIRSRIDIIITREDY
jgi:hypothetical protein